jgi:ElaB/YqjD/DUF883 family membrane-anchored ribosome-binding protein
MNENRPEEDRGNGGWARQAQGAGQTIEEAQKQAEQFVGEVDEWLRTFVRERPFATVAAAVAAGFLVGRILSRK